MTPATVSAESNTKLDKTINKIINATEIVLDKTLAAAEITINWLANNSNAVLLKMQQWSEKILHGINTFSVNNGWLLRHISLPWSTLIPKVYEKLIQNSKQNLPILQPGNHYITAEVGGGKSLTSLVLAYLLFEVYGYGSYFTSPVEKPKLSEDGSFWYVNFPVVDMKDYYRDFKKIKNFNTQKRKFIFKDEEHTRHNPRMNNTKDYNATFIPEHNDEVLQRHQGMQGIYKLSQHNRTDSQAMEILSWLHEVRAVKGLPIKQWLKDGLFRIFPYQIEVYSYKVKVDFSGHQEKMLIKGPYILDVPYEILEQFETRGEANRFSNLPYDD